MNNFKVWLFAIVISTVSVVAIGSALLISIANTPSSSSSPSPTTATSQPITVTGNLTCLPHRTNNGVTTAECAFGLKAGDKYYGLDNLNQEALATPFETTIRVTGKLVPSPTDSTYNTIGTITVTKFEKL